MKDGSRSSDDLSSSNSSIVHIQDIVCAALPPGENENNPVGEFGNNEANERTQLSRIYSTIKDLVKKTATEHKSNNFDNNNQVKEESKNNITRLITNEFLFYTKQPLTLNEFTQLQNKLTQLSAKQPENMHLVLGSFAVRTPDNKVMNVVPHIECGPQPVVNLIVKNYPSDADPSYREKNGDRQIKIENVGINVPPESLGMKGVEDKLKIPSPVINGKKQPFSFNNVITCQTKGGEKFFSCVDICYDHNKGAARNRFEHKLDMDVKKSQQRKTKNYMPNLCSHIVTSNSHSVLPSKKLAEPVTHCDPVYTPKECKSEANKSFTEITPTFGTKLNVVITSPMPCNQFSDSSLLERIQNHNQNVSKTLNSTSFTSKIVDAGKKGWEIIFSGSSESNSKNNSKQKSASAAKSDTSDGQAESISDDLLAKFKHTTSMMENETHRLKTLAKNSSSEKSHKNKENEKQTWIPTMQLKEAQSGTLRSASQTSRQENATSSTGAIEKKGKRM